MFKEGIIVFDAYSIIADMDKLDTRNKCLRMKRKWEKKSKVRDGHFR